MHAKRLLLRDNCVFSELQIYQIKTILARVQILSSAASLKEAQMCTLFVEGSIPATLLTLAHLASALGFLSQGIWTQLGFPTILSKLGLLVPAT